MQQRLCLFSSRCKKQKCIRQSNQILTLTKLDSRCAESCEYVPPILLEEAKENVLGLTTDRWASVPVLWPGTWKDDGSTA